MDEGMTEGWRRSRRSDEPILGTKDAEHQGITDWELVCHNGVYIILEGAFWSDLIRLSRHKGL